jgi:hypothetical protein
MIAGIGELLSQAWVTVGEAGEAGIIAASPWSSTGGIHRLEVGPYLVKVFNAVHVLHTWLEGGRYLLPSSTPSGWESSNPSQAFTSLSLTATPISFFTVPQQQ